MIHPLTRLLTLNWQDH